ncbi:MAG: DUF1553 domain-containing protein [Rhodopirellula sp.]|nr:DUF1553 domain-containing protein [Rhodopirellula sp.]
MKSHCLLFVAFLFATSVSTTAAGEIDFNRDIRPIISDNCFACHGFDQSARKGDLRLDQREAATEDRGGYAVIVPGRPDESALIERVTSTDRDTVMPPLNSHREPLDQKSIETLKEWIRQGAPWGEHWAFLKPKRAFVPTDEPHAIDYFVQQRLTEQKLRFARQASAHTLIRRLSFDLTGLPPAAELVEDFPQSPTENDWDDLVNQLLASPHFGERMAMWWLDGARYSDTDGFQSDSTRTNWPWRDWVVDSFNRNKPFDEFTVEQFAGDLLPNATPEQKLATCFHRNHMNNGEGGRDPEESRVDYVLDRVNTTGTLFLGLTLGCTQCHDHKFDPVSQRDYYSLTAYFNSIDETGAARNAAKPYLKYKSPYAQRAVDEAAVLTDQTAAALALVQQHAEIEFVPWLDEQLEKVAAGFEPWATIVPARLATTEGYVLSQVADGIIVSSPSDLPQDDFVVTVSSIDSSTKLSRISGLKLEVFPHASHTAGRYSFSRTGEFILTNVKLLVRKRGSSQIREVGLASAVADVEGVGEDSSYKTVRDTLDDDPRKGWTTRTKPSDVPHTAVFALEEPLILAADEELDIVLMQRSLAPRELMGRFRLSVTDQRGAAVRSLSPMPLEQLAKLQPTDSKLQLIASKVDSSLRKKLLEQFLEDHSAWQAAKQRNELAKSQLAEAKKAVGDQDVMVLGERKEPRRTHVLERGVWDQHGEEVQRAVLSAVLKRPAAEVPSRLELGRWVVSPENPLTARVITNQVWQLFFGAGLVRTPGDFGLQGESPTHPELLDWLAVEFMESGWDLKHLVRTIVSSRTYRQDSSVSAELLELDPENRLLARGARFRLPSWMIRDAALQASGLLNDAIGGPPVFPYQPPGVWRDQFMGRFVYQPSIGPAQYRRTLYAFWRRTSAPTFLFDSAMRRTCEVVPRRTNTPLHALTLLNDTTSLEAARTLADQAVAAASDDITKRVELLFLRILSRKPTADEAGRVLVPQYKVARIYYDEHPDEAVKLATVGQLAAPKREAAADIAATMLLANLLLNLDEGMTHE